MTTEVKKQQLQGTVVSDKMDKTVVVQVDEKKRHEKYHKTYKVSKRMKAHDAENQYHIGDVVLIESCKPISRDKTFVVVKKV